MKRKALLTVIVVALVLTLCAGLFAACNKNAGATKYTVTFEVGEGAEAVESQSVEAGSEIDLPSTTRAGYKLSGWQVDGEGDVLAVGSKYKVEADVKLVAKWAPVTYYSVSYSLGAGVDGQAPATQSNIEEGTSIQLAQLPDGVTREGYRFAGWQADGEGATLLAGASYQVNANVQMVARWIQQVTVTYSLGSGPVGDAPQQVTVDINGSIQLPGLTGVTYANYRFAGWQVNGQGEVLAAGSTYQVSADVQLVASWMRQYNVTFDLGGYTGAFELQSGAYDENAVITLPADLVREKYRLDGWYINDDKIENNSHTVTADVTIRANWVEQVTVTYSLGEGASAGDAPQAVTVDKDSHINLPTIDATTRWANHKLTGWKADGAAAAAVEPGADYQASADVTLVAQWTESYLVTYQADGGNVPDAAYVDKVAEGDTTVNLANLTWADHIFFGWKANGEGDTLNANSSYTLTSDVTFNAVARAVSDYVKVYEKVDGDSHYSLAITASGVAVYVANVGETPSFTESSASSLAIVNNVGSDFVVTLKEDGSVEIKKSSEDFAMTEWNNNVSAFDGVWVNSAANAEDKDTLLMLYVNNNLTKISGLARGSYVLKGSFITADFGNTAGKGYGTWVLVSAEADSMTALNVYSASSDSAKATAKYTFNPAGKTSFSGGYLFMTKESVGNNTFTRGITFDRDGRVSEIYYGDKGECYDYDYRSNILSYVNVTEQEGTYNLVARLGANTVLKWSFTSADSCLQVNLGEGNGTIALIPCGNAASGGNPFTQYTVKNYGNDSAVAVVLEYIVRNEGVAVNTTRAIYFSAQKQGWAFKADTMNEDGSEFQVQYGEVTTYAKRSGTGVNTVLTLAGAERGTYTPQDGSGLEGDLYLDGFGEARLDDQEYGYTYDAVEKLVTVNEVTYKLDDESNKYEVNKANLGDVIKGKTYTATWAESSGTLTIRISAEVENQYSYSYAQAGVAAAEEETGTYTYNDGQGTISFDIASGDINGVTFKIIANGNALTPVFDASYINFGKWFGHYFKTEAYEEPTENAFVSHWTYTAEHDPWICFTQDGESMAGDYYYYGQLVSDVEADLTNGVLRFKISGNSNSGYHYAIIDNNGGAKQLKDYESASQTTVYNYVADAYQFPGFAQEYYKNITWKMGGADWTISIDADGKVLTIAEGGESSQVAVTKYCDINGVYNWDVYKFTYKGTVYYFKADDDVAVGEIYLHTKPGHDDEGDELAVLYNTENGSIDERMQGTYSGTIKNKDVTIVVGENSVTINGKTASNYVVYNQSDISTTYHVYGMAFYATGLEDLGEGLDGDILLLHKWSGSSDSNPYAFVVNFIVEFNKVPDHKWSNSGKDYSVTRKLASVDEPDGFTLAGDWYMKKGDSYAFIHFDVDNSSGETIKAWSVSICNNTDKQTVTRIADEGVYSLTIGNITKYTYKITVQSDGSIVLEEGEDAYNGTYKKLGEEVQPDGVASIPEKLYAQAGESGTQKWTAIGKNSNLNVEIGKNTFTVSTQATEPTEYTLKYFLGGEDKYYIVLNDWSEWTLDIAGETMTLACVHGGYRTNSYTLSEQFDEVKLEGVYLYTDGDTTTVFEFSNDGKVLATQGNTNVRKSADYKTIAKNTLQWTVLSDTWTATVSDDLGSISIKSETGDAATYTKQADDAYNGFFGKFIGEVNGAVHQLAITNDANHTVIDVKDYGEKTETYSDSSSSYIGWYIAGEKTIAWAYHSWGSTYNVYTAKLQDDGTLLVDYYNDAQNVKFEKDDYEELNMFEITQGKRYVGMFNNTYYAFTFTDDQYATVGDTSKFANTKSQKYTTVAKNMIRLEYSSDKYYITIDSTTSAPASFSVKHNSDTATFSQDKDYDLDGIWEGAQKNKKTAIFINGGTITISSEVSTKGYALNPNPGKYDFEFITSRHAICKTVKYKNNSNRDATSTWKLSRSFADSDGTLTVTIDTTAIKTYYPTSCTKVAVPEDFDINGEWHAGSSTDYKFLNFSTAEGKVSVTASSNSIVETVEDITVYAKGAYSFTINKIVYTAVVSVEDDVTKLNITSSSSSAPFAVKFDKNTLSSATIPEELKTGGTKKDGVWNVYGSGTKAESVKVEDPVIKIILSGGSELTSKYILGQSNNYVLIMNDYSQWTLKNDGTKWVLSCTAGAFDGATDYKDNELGAEITIQIEGVYEYKASYYYATLIFSADGKVTIIDGDDGNLYKDVPYSASGSAGVTFDAGGSAWVVNITEGVAPNPTKMRIVSASNTALQNRDYVPVEATGVSDSDIKGNWYCKTSSGFVTINIAESEGKLTISSAALTGNASELIQIADGVYDFVAKEGSDSGTRIIVKSADQIEIQFYSYLKGTYAKGLPKEATLPAELYGTESKVWKGITQTDNKSDLGDVTITANSILFTVSEAALSSAHIWLLAENNYYITMSDDSVWTLKKGSDGLWVLRCTSGSGTSLGDQTLLDVEKGNADLPEELYGEDSIVWLATTTSSGARNIGKVTIEQNKVSFKMGDAALESQYIWLLAENSYYIIMKDSASSNTTGWTLKKSSSTWTLTCIQGTSDEKKYKENTLSECPEDVILSGTFEGSIGRSWGSPADLKLEFLGDMQVKVTRNESDKGTVSYITTASGVIKFTTADDYAYTVTISYNVLSVADSYSYSGDLSLNIDGTYTLNEGSDSLTLNHEGNTVEYDGTAGNGTGTYTVSIQSDGTINITINIATLDVINGTYVYTQNTLTKQGEDGKVYTA